MRKLVSIFLLLILLLNSAWVTIPAHAQSLGTEVTYPPEITTDYDKLNAIYNLIEQMRLEHNRVGAIARSNWKLYAEKWYQYSEIFKKKQEPLITEYVELRDKLRKAVYDDRTWNSMSTDQKLSASIILMGNKETQKSIPTKATYKGLTQLKAVDFDSLNGSFIDPTEDLTTYTETDEDGDITVTVPKADVDTMRNDAVSHVRKSYGAGHFGAVDHLLTLYIADVNGGGRSGFWAITDTNYTLADMASNSEGISAYITIGYGGTRYGIYLRLTEGGTSEDYYFYANANPVTAYPEITTAAGACNLYIYSDAARTSLVDTLAVGGLGASTFSTVEAIASEGSSYYASSTCTYYVEDLDLQEGGGPSAPTVTTQAASSVEATTATGNGNITATGGENADHRGVVWDDATHGDPGNTAPDLSDYVTAGGDYTDEAGDFGTGAFTASMTGLPTGTTIYYRAWAHNSGGYAYGAEQTFLTKPAAPTNVSATDGAHTDKVVITWTKSTGATDYQVYRDGAGLGWAGDVATYDDNGATAGTISSAGTASASDGTSTAHVTLSLAGEATANGTNHTYKARAKNATGESSDSATDTGYRGVGAITYQWQVDNGGGFANIAGGTTDPYDYVGADAGTITAGNAVASDGTSPLHVTLSVAGESANNGTTWNYQCIVSSTGASNSPQTSTQDTGYRGTSTISYQWQVDNGGGFGNIVGGTTDPYDYTSADPPTITPGTAAASDGTSSTHVTLAVAGELGNNGATWNYQCVLTAAWASNSPQTTGANTGYRGTSALTYQWERSVADADGSFGNIPGATSDPYNDADGAVAPSGRYYYAVVSMTGATQQGTTHDRGYKAAVTGGGTGIIPIFIVLAIIPLALLAREWQKKHDEVQL